MGEAQRARAERNRLKALSLQKARLMAHPYTAGQQQAGTSSSDLKGLSHEIDLNILTEIYWKKVSLSKGRGWYFSRLMRVNVGLIMFIL